MIASLSGRLVAHQPTRVTLDVSGIGFELTVPLSTSKTLETQAAGCEPSAVGCQPQVVTLHVQTVFTREGVSLFGFATRDEKDVFNRLTAISGIGPRAALNLLSRFPPAEITSILNDRKIETLKTVPGIGPKKAERILNPPSSSRRADAGMTIPDVRDEPATNALMALGLTRGEAQKRLERIPERAGLPLSEVLTRALRIAD